MSHPLARIVPLAALAAALPLPLRAQCEMALIQPSGAAGGDGRAELLAAWQNTALIGAPGKGSGVVQVFERTAAGWIFTQELVGAGVTGAARFGSAVAVFEDTAVVGAPNDGAFGAGAGSAHVFELTTAGWLQTAVLGAPKAQLGAQFGWSVSASSQHVAAGAPLDRDPADGVQRGGAYVFERSPAGWILDFEFHPPAGTEPLQQFGAAVAVAGGQLAVGADRASSTFVHEGLVYSYHLPGSLWVFDQVVSSPLAEDFAHFGAALSLTADGERLMVGAPDEGPDDNGNAIIFEESADGWKASFELGVVGSGRLGSSVAQRVAPSSAFAVGAPLTELGGRAYLFQVSSTLNLSSVPPPEPAFGGNYGSSVALTASHLLAGAPGADVAGIDSGAVQVFPASIGLISDPNLYACPFQISVSGGGVQTLSLFSESAFGTYLLLGSASGTSPGVPLPSTVNEILPLNYPDPYLEFTLANPNTHPLADSLGGFTYEVGLGQRAEASFSLPPGGDPALVGLLVHHAFMTPAPPSPLYASNAVPLQLVP